VRYRCDCSGQRGAGAAWSRTRCGLPVTEPRAPIPAGDVLMLDSAIGAAGRYEARLEASGGLAEADEHRGGTLSPLAAFSEKLCHYKGAWGREKRPLAERQGSIAATRRVPDRATNRWHGRSGSSRTIGCVFLPGVADLQLGATRKRLAWPSAMETATLSLTAADVAVDGVRRP
jgi:hypothetical protein